jgi:hypothetical protein
MTDGRSGTSVPAPLAVLVELADSETQPFKRAWRLIDCFEWAVKWSTTLVMSDLLTHAGLSDGLKLALAQGLRTPSLGTWLRFYREALGEPAIAGRPWAAWDRLVPLDNRHRIVAFRNDYAHGAVHTDETSSGHWGVYRPVLGELLRTPMFTAARVRPAEHEDGELRRALAEVVGLEEILDLWPLGLYARPAGTDDIAFYFFNALRHDKVERLNYDLPDRVRDGALWSQFDARLPLDAWRAAAATDLDPFARHVDLLTASFTGRKDDIETVARFARQGDGTLVVWGPPGIGKSALLGLTMRTLRADAGDELVVLDVFIRRGDLIATPAAFLRSLVLRLDVVLGLAPTHAETVEQWYDALSERLRAFELRDGRTLVVCVDGLDEAPQLCAVLPLAGTRVRVILGSRPVPAVQEHIDERPGTVRPYDLEQLTDADVRALLYDVVDKYRSELVDGPYVPALRRRAEGNPLFLTLVCAELFAHPDMVGRADVIPDGMAGVLRAAVDRATDRGRDEVAGQVLALLAAAGERLTVGVIAGLIGLSASRVRPAIDACLELLHREGRGAAASYRLFHDALRTWLREEHGPDVEEVERLLGLAALDVGQVPDVAVGYLHRHGLGHLRDSGSADRRPDVAARVQALWTDLNRVRAKLADQGAEDLLAEASEWYAPSGGDGDAAETLARLVAEDHRGDRPQLTAELLHAVLVYQPSTALLEAMLGWLTDEAFLRRCGVASSKVPLLLAGFAYILGNVRRKQGGPANLDAAAALFARGESLLAAESEGPAGAGPAELRVHARIAYDQGYVGFLEGDADASLAAFDRSVELSEAAGDALGAWMSRIVRDRVGFLHERLPAEDWTVTLTSALELFAEAAATSPRADRWVKNTLAHLFEVCQATGDRAGAARWLAELEEHPWIRRYQRDRAVQLARARMALLDGRAAEATEDFEAVLGDLRSRPPAERYDESLARDIVDFGDALAAAGRSADAQRVWRYGIALPRHAGNAVWQQRLEQRLGERGA